MVVFPALGREPRKNSVLSHFSARDVGDDFSLSTEPLVEKVMSPDAPQHFLTKDLLLEEPVTGTVLGSETVNGQPAIWHSSGISFGRDSTRIDSLSNSENSSVLNLLASAV